MGFQIETYFLCRKVDFVVRVYNRTNERVQRIFIRRNDAYVTAHNFYVGQIASECAVVVYDEPFGTDCNEYVAVFHAFHVKHSLVADEEFSSLT